MTSCQAYLRLMRVDKPIGFLLLLWPTLWALWVASHGTPAISLLGIFISGVFLMRSAGCVINDILDRRFDGQVQRTRQRPLVTGEVTTGKAIILFVILCLLAFGLACFLNRLTIQLAFIAGLLTIVYPWCKRITHMPQLVLGIAFGMSVPMAFAAVSEKIPLAGWVLFLITVLWAIIYDTFYALVDKEDDLKIGVKSTAILFAQYDLLVIGILQTLMVVLFIYLGLLLNLSRFYYVFLVLAALSFIYQQHLAKERDPQQCFKAFLNNTWFGFFVFAGISMGIS